VANNYDEFATSLLQERQQAGLPPFVHQALMRAEAKVLADALAFLQVAANSLNIEGIVMNEPIPMTMTRVANVERAQLLVESTSRPALQAFLKEWLELVRSQKTKVKWSLEVDPVEI
jgi:primosomal protein N' (replication factor Y)